MFGLFERKTSFSTNFVLITGSIALVLFGLGYALRGLGSAIEPISKIIDTDSENSNSED